MEWGGATIGWAYSDSIYETHPLSGAHNSDDIGCRHSSTSSIIVYRLVKSKFLVTSLFFPFLKF